MPPPGESLIQYCGAPIPRLGEGYGVVPEGVSISSPRSGSDPPTTFTATVAVTPPDTMLTSCIVEGQMAVISFDTSTGLWNATFTGLPSTNGQFVTLTATGNMGGCDCVQIQIGSTMMPIANPMPPGGPTSVPVISLQMSVANCTCNAGALGQENMRLEKKHMLRTLRLKRSPLTQPHVGPFWLTFKGTPTADFVVGGALTRPGERIENCHVGDKKAECIDHNGLEWLAVFKDIKPGPYPLTITRDGKQTDQGHILIEATK
jgi:hypothetical protein